MSTTSNPDVQPEPLQPTAAANDEPMQGDAPAPKLQVEVCALSDVGCVRTNNEDSFGYSIPHGIFVVCDGMGGMASGEIASAGAVQAVLETFIASAESGAPVSARLLQAIEMANRAVWLLGQTPEHKGMGTTLVAAAIDGENLVIGNVGDSRAYLVEDGQCTQLTVDHSYVNELIRNGTLTLEGAADTNLEGMESVITRAIGAEEEVQPDFFSVDLKAGVMLLLATDGLSRFVIPEEIRKALTALPLNAICIDLIETAKQRGGIDNITAMVLHIF